MQMELYFFGNQWRKGFAFGDHLEAHQKAFPEGHSFLGKRLLPLVLCVERLVNCWAPETGLVKHVWSSFKDWDAAERFQSCMDFEPDGLQVSRWPWISPFMTDEEMMTRVSAQSFSYTFCFKDNTLYVPERFSTSMICGFLGCVSKLLLWCQWEFLYSL